MDPIEASLRVGAPREEVFAKAIDLRGLPSFVRGITELEILSDGPVGEGTRFRETRRLHGREASEEMEITEFNPPEHYVVEAENHGTRYISRFQFEPTTEGTRVTVSFHAEPQSWFAKISGPLIMPLMKRTLLRCLEDDLEDLKQEVEKTPQ